MSERRYRTNQYIRVPDVMVIDDTGAALGQMPTEQALALAQSKGLDLVEIAPMARPPVCKILDFNAFLYQQEKLLRKSKANQKRVELKGIRLTFKMGDHDREVRLRQSRAFLDDGHKVQLEMRLRGRENALAEHGRKVMIEFMQLLGPDVVAEQPLGRMGNRFTTILGKKK